MKYFKQCLTFIWVICLVISALFPLGLFLTLYYAINFDMGFMSLGIGCLVFGVFGAPLLWIIFANVVKYRKLVYAVMEKKIFSINELCEYLKLDYETVSKRVDACIRRDYFENYTRHGDKIIVSPKHLETTMPYTCLECGTNYSLPLLESPKCPNCGSEKIAINNNQEK